MATANLTDEVNRLVGEGWRFRNHGGSYAAIHDDGRFFGATKVADIVAAIAEVEAANQAATSNEAANAQALVEPDKLDSATAQAIADSETSA